MRRLFHDDQFDEMAFEFEAGNKEYVIDVDLTYSICFVESFKNEYPNEYEAFLKTFVGVKEGDIDTFTSQNVDLLEKMMQGSVN